VRAALVLSCIVVAVAPSITSGVLSDHDETVWGAPSEYDHPFLWRWKPRSCIATHISCHPALLHANTAFHATSSAWLIVVVVFKTCSRVVFPPFAMAVQATLHCDSSCRARLKQNGPSGACAKITTSCLPFNYQSSFKGQPLCWPRPKSVQRRRVGCKAMDA
jgi:hypothetical protein